MTLHPAHARNESPRPLDNRQEASGELAKALEIIDAQDNGDDLLIEVLARRSPALAPALDAVVNAQRSLNALRPALASLPVAATPELAQGAMATENAWRSMEQEFGLLSAQEASRSLGSRAKGRSTLAHDRRENGQLLGVRRGNAVLYPGFQFDQNGDVHHVIPALLRLARQARRSDEDLAQWICLPSGYLDGDRPVDRLQDTDAVLAAAQGHFGAEW